MRFKIVAIGTGYVGSVTGACLADLGNEVVCVDNNADKIAAFKEGKVPIYEPGLEELTRRNQLEGRLTFSTDIAENVRDAQLAFICVGTPPKDDGEPDLSAVESVMREIAKSSIGNKLVVVEKSTVPVQTNVWLNDIVAGHDGLVEIASNPEFLREGSAVHDFMHPDRIVVGTESGYASALLLEVYKPLNALTLVTDVKSAELIKHASNAFLSMKISFANLVARVCEKTGADVEMVMAGVGADKRIGREFLNAGLGYGGFCFPKDLEAFIATLRKYGIDSGLLEQVRTINDSQRQRFVDKMTQSLGGVEGKVIGILGLAFKPNTDDMRYAPSIDIIKALQQRGAMIQAYDPKATANARALMPDVRYVDTPYAAAKGADCIAILTEWGEFSNLDLARIKEALKQPVIFDGRNVYNLERMSGLGVHYSSVGRREIKP